MPIHPDREPKMSKKERLALTYTISVLALLVLALLDLHVGAVKLSSSEIFQALTGNADSRIAAIVNSLRLPRLLTAILAGIGLAMSGSVMQAVFMNPLADPHILGISAGAGTGVAIATLCTAGTGIALSISAAAGAFCMSLIILWISLRTRRASALLITGVMLGYIMSALTSVIEYQANEMRLKMFWNWSAGSFGSSGWTELQIMAVALIAGFLISLSLSKGLSLLLFGDDYAASAGANVRKIRVLSMLGCSLMTGVVTAYCGPIGFVGIVSPHIAKAFSGQAVMKHVIPLSCIMGAVICLGGDILSRVWETPLPVGSTIALIGIPIIFLILRRQTP